MTEYKGIFAGLRGKTPVNPLLVTGSHRSGTTWVSKVLLKTGLFGEVVEPLNPDMGSVTGITRRFQHVRVEDVAIIRELEERLAAARRGKRRSLVKDPIGIFATAMYIERFDADVWLAVRNPLSFASSLKRLEWKFDFSHMLEQETLMQEYLYPYERELRAEKERNEKGSSAIRDQAVLLWNVIYHSAVVLKQKHPEKIRFVKHEDLSERPLETFRQQFRNFGLPFTAEVRSFIGETTSSRNPSEVDTRDVVHQIYRDSSSNIYNYRARLEAEEVEKIIEGTEKVAAFFYRKNEYW